MRDHLLIYVNGKPYQVRGEAAFQTLSGFLREDLCKVGTKIVCEEGDCGACTVLVGRTTDDGSLSYKSINSCIQFMYQLDCTHVVTIEGLKANGQLNPVQEAMVECHGAQCGFCTPGFVVAMCGLFDAKCAATECQIKDALTGNLCRCTGYEPIIKAGLSVDTNKIVSLAELYPSQTMSKDFAQHAVESVTLKTAERTVFLPASVADAAEFKHNNPGAVIVAGGTDIGVLANKRYYEPPAVMSLCNLAGMSDLTIENGVLTAGARVTLSELEDRMRKDLPQLSELLWLFGSPQIRNAATLAGNIANASPIGDTPPLMFVLEAEIELTSKAGTRRVRINEFYKGYKKMDMQPAEFITRVIVPLPKTGETIKLYKSSKRKHLDISSATAAFRVQLKDDDLIESVSIAYGGVGPVIVRLPRTEEFLKGKKLTVSLMREAGEIAVGEITPISDVRGSATFRNQLAKNFLLKFYHEVVGGRAAECRK